MSPFERAGVAAVWYVELDDLGLAEAASAAFHVLTIYVHGLDQEPITDGPLAEVGFLASEWLAVDDQWTDPDLGEAMRAAARRFISPRF